MSDVAIRAEGLGKQYLIGHQASQERYVALRDVLARSAKGFARSARDLLRGRQLIAGDEIEEFWALRDLNFEIKRGEIVGVIGRNGAGKSTLLKILSRITEPTEGRVEIRGRVASLLEVGTGFHPELSGRENIFLNGAILGMSRAEIRRKFDEIVAFAEVEKFLDTPVKRYSSGMYVRLAFAVAAHLEPEILVVDEVLAVGDAEFQKKCLGKMGEVAGQGRTVLFVSHNTSAIQRLCKSCCVMESGRLMIQAPTDKAIAYYLNREFMSQRTSLNKLVGRSGRGQFRFSEFALLDGERSPVSFATTAQDICFRLVISGSSEEPDGECRVGILLQNRYEEVVFNCASVAARNETLLIGASSIVECYIPRLPLDAGDYFLTLYLERKGVVEDWIDKGIMITVRFASFYGTERNSAPGWEGKTVLVPHSWRVQSSDLANNWR